MSLIILFQPQSKLAHILGLTFLCVSYFVSSFVAEPVDAFFRISYFIGHILVNEFLRVCKFTAEALRLIYSFIQILHEDSVVFIKDAAEKLVYATSVLNYIYICLEELGWFCIRIISAVGQAVLDAVDILQSTIIYLKYGIGIIGSTVQEFPTHLPASINANNLVSFVFTSFDIIRECLGKIYLFFFDIPLDIVYGLVFTTAIVTVAYIKYKDICVIISSAVVKSFKQIVNFIIYLWTRRFKKKKSKIKCEIENDERLCVVCQYQLKEILLLPCKHLCLCADCCGLVTNVLLPCPICRSQIEHTIKVYL